MRLDYAPLTLLTGSVPDLQITRNAKHGLNSWKWSNLAWNTSDSLTICFSVLPLSDRQMPLREKHSDIGKMTECF